MVLGDIDGDGDLDLLTAGPFSGPQVYVFTNNGQGVFSQRATVAIPPDNGEVGPESVALGDVNGDGFLDFVATHPGSVSVRLNDGHGNFSGSQEVPADGASGKRGVALADINGDGFLDILAANAEKNTVSIRLNDGKGAFSGSSEATVGAGTANGAGAANLALADFNGDGALDIAMLGDQSVSVRLNQPTPATTATSYRLHAGGGALATTRGPFAADQSYDAANSAAFTTTAPIAGTPDPALYQTERFSTHGALRYALPVANGQYTVVLHFAELYWTQPGQRVFDAALEGQKVLDHYDIVKKVGPRTATTETFAVTVADGVLNLDLTVPYLSGGMDQAKLSALEVLPAAPAASRGALAAAAPKSPVPLGASVYPNPSTGRFTLACTAAAAQAATLSLTDELGRVVHQQPVQLQAGPNALAVRAEGAAPGLYQLVLRTADGQTHRQKVLIQP